MGVSTQLVWLFVLGAPVACVAWTVTHEDVFADARRLCMDRSRHGRRWLERKFFYLFTCESLLQPLRRTGRRAVD